MRVDSFEVTRIAEHLSMSEAGFRARYLAPTGDRLRDGDTSRCVFLAEGAHAACTIYPVRPSRCRTWPYWDELRDDPEALRRAQRICPGIVIRDGDGVQDG